METVWEEDTTRRSSLKNKIDNFEEELNQLKLKQASSKPTEFKFPFKWKNAANKSFSKLNQDKILCLYLSKKGQIIGPMFLDIYGGHIIIYKNKAHEYRPRELWFMKIGIKTVPVYIIREIDRKPVSNRDWDAVVARGDSTKNDELLLKMVKLAQLQKVAAAGGKAILYIVGGLIAAVVVGYVVFG